MRVLIATDGSSAAERAVQLACSISWPPGTQLRLVTVVEPIEPVIAESWVKPANSESGAHAAELEERAQVVLEHAARELARTGVDLSRRIMRGRAASKILENAQDFAADLIIVGNRGHGTIASMILGSVSAEIADRAPCPVLVARGTHFTRAVLGHDGSSFARSAENLIARWPIFEKVAIEVTSVAQLAPPWTTGLALAAYAPAVSEITDAAKAIVGERRDIAEAATRRLQEAGRRASARVVNGFRPPNSSAWPGRGRPGGAGGGGGGPGGGGGGTGGGGGAGGVGGGGGGKEGGEKKNKGERETAKRKKGNKAREDTEATRKKERGGAGPRREKRKEKKNPRRGKGKSSLFVLFSGTDDKLQAAAVLTAGAAALGKPVNVFLQYWALDAFRADRIDQPLPLAPEAGPAGKAAVERMRVAGQQPWAETLRQAKDIGEVDIQACSLSMDLLRLSSRTSSTRSSTASRA